MAFDEMNFIEPITRALAHQRYTTPTPIQEQAIPHLLEGKDLIGIAQTGTGKTAAFIVPLLQRLTKAAKPTIKHHPRALILAPTRELAAQIDKSCATYGAYTTITHTVINGGVSQQPQVKALTQGVDILIATPGRLLDLMNQGYIKLDRIETLVLDEADRMLDMGFVNDIRKLLRYLPKTHQTIMFSATMSPEIKQLAKDFLKEPVHVEVSAEDTTLQRIEQHLLYVEKAHKLPLLLHLMSARLDHVLIFTRTKAAADKVARALAKKKIDAESLHSDKSQSQRTRALEHFKKGKTVLVATDIAARGIDVNGITHVINYDLPNDPENYIHRIGRTARAGTSGTAYTFCDETEKDYLHAIERVTRQHLTIINHPYHSDMAQNSTQRAKQRGTTTSRSKGSHRAPKQRYGADSAAKGTERTAKTGGTAAKKSTSFGRKKPFPSKKRSSYR